MRLLLRSLAAPIRRHAGLLAAPRPGSGVPGTCLDADALSRAADGLSTPADRRHLADCAECRAELVDLHALLESAAVRQELGRLTASGAPGRRRWVVPAGLAAAAVAAAILIAAPQGADEDRLRDHPAAPPQPVPVLAEPRGAAVPPHIFRWSATPAATQYRLSLFDAEGGLVWTAETPDTSVRLPSDVLLEPGVEYWWRIEARIDFDRWAASDLLDFVPR